MTKENKQTKKRSSIKVYVAAALMMAVSIFVFYMSSSMINKPIDALADYNNSKVSIFERQCQIKEDIFNENEMALCESAAFNAEVAVNEEYYHFKMIAHAIATSMLVLAISVVLLNKKD